MRMGGGGSVPLAPQQQRQDRIYTQHAHIPIHQITPHPPSGTQTRRPCVRAVACSCLRALLCMQGAASMLRCCHQRELSDWFQWPPRYHELWRFHDTVPRYAMR